MGLNSLLAVVISDGSAMLIKGGTIKSEYYWWKRGCYIPVYWGYAEENRYIDMDLLS
jgi:hypothetical protein